MRFYKKNPAIEGIPWVCGKEMKDDAVVCGDEFVRFADPNTFPGRPPKLIEIPFGDLSEEQIGQIKGLVSEQAAKPPRHLGVIRSDSIPSSPTKGIDIVTTPKDMGTGAKTSTRKEALNTVDTVKVESDIDGMLSGKMPALKEYYTKEEFVDAFPGVTSRNVDTVLAAFENFEKLSKASNSALRKAGVQPNFFDRVRKAAKREIQVYDRKKRSL